MRHPFARTMSLFGQRIFELKRSNLEFARLRHGLHSQRAIRVLSIHKRQIVRRDRHPKSAPRRKKRLTLLITELKDALQNL